MYINDFDDIFFNIDDPKSKPVKLLFEECSSVIDELIEKFVEIINELTVAEITIDQYSDYIVVLFTRKICEYLDAISALFRKSIITPSYTVFRSMYETCVQIEFILEDDTVNRASCYYLDSILQRIEYSKKLNGKIEANGQPLDATKYETVMMKFINSNAPLAKANDLRSSKIGNRKYIKWYNICSDKKNLSELADKMGMSSYHRDLYDSLSIEAHGFNSTNVMIFNKDGVNMELIRAPFNAGALFNMVCSLSMGVLTKKYKYVTMEEEHVQDAFEFFTALMKRRDELVAELSCIKR